MDTETKSMHITPVGGNVFADLGFEPEEAAALQSESKRIISEKQVLTEHSDDLKYKPEQPTKKTWRLW